MIKLVRIDHRLLHGQVIFSWTKQYDINHIIVADDQVPEEPMTVMALSLAKPADCQLDIVSIDKVAQVLAAKPDDRYLLLVKGPKEAVELVKNVPEIKAINYGGVAKKANSIAYGKAVYLNEAELAATRDLLARHIELYVQQVPTAPVEVVDFMN